MYTSKMETYGEVDMIWRSLNKCGRFQLFQWAVVLLDTMPACFTILSAVFTDMSIEVEVYVTYQDILVVNEGEPLRYQQRPWSSLIVACTVDGPNTAIENKIDSVGYIPEHFCEDESWRYNTTNSNVSIKYVENCYVEVVNNDSGLLIERQECSHNFVKDNTYSSQWGLVCSRSNLAALAQSLVIGGQGIGAFTMSHLSDRFGRKTVHVLSHIAVMTTMLIMAFSTNIYMLLALRLVAGTFQQGIICTGATLIIELFPKEIRAYFKVCTFFTWSGGIMVLSLIGYLFRDIHWRYMQIGLVIFSAYSLVEWWLLEESVRWLLINGRTEEAERILRKAARWNRVKFTNIDDLHKEAHHLRSTENGKDDIRMPSVTDVEVDTADGEDVSTLHATSEKYTIIDILKNPELRIDTFILWYAWICAAGTYYGLTLVSTHLAGDRFVNFFLSGLMEWPSAIAGLYLYNRIGRKKTLITWVVVEGVSLVVSTVLLTLFGHIHVLSLIATAFSLIGKMAASGTFSAVFLYTPEIYPTNYRNSGLGISSSVGRIGGILAPFASNLALIAMWIPGAIFGGMCFLLVILALRLPESATHELPSTMKDRDRWTQTE